MARTVEEHTQEAEITFERVGVDTIQLFHSRYQPQRWRYLVVAHGMLGPRGISQYDPKNNEWRQLNLRVQLRKLFKKQIPGMVCTVVLLAVYVGILAGYDARTVTHRGQVTYNTLTTANLIALGLSFFGVLKTMAKVVRWRFLAGRPLEPREVDLILGADSLENVFYLMYRSWRRNFREVTAAVALGVLLLNLAAQITVSIIQLNASYESGHNSSGIVSTFGTVLVPKLDCFYTPIIGADDCSALNSSSAPAVAHSYGESINSQEESECLYTGDAQDIEGKQHCTYFRRDDGPVPEFAVRFADYNPNDIEDRQYPFLDTHRFLTVNATNCRCLDAIPAYNPPQNVAGNLEYELTFPSGPDGSVNISIPRGDMAPNATEYIWHGTRTPGNETDMSDETCGRRCVYLYAVQDSWIGSQHSITTCQCEIHVSKVSNATSDVHRIPSHIARIAAAGIALTGKAHDANLDLNIQPSDVLVLNWDQFHSYPDGSDWATLPNETATGVGMRMARFAAAALGTLAQRAPTAEAQGMVPALGNVLSVKWRYVAGLAASIAAAHVLLVVLMLYLVHDVPVPDDSALVVSRLLNRVIGGLPDDEKARLDGKVLAEHIAGKATLSNARYESQSE